MGFMLYIMYPVESLNLYVLCFPLIEVGKKKVRMGDAGTAVQI